MSLFPGDEMARPDTRSRSAPVAGYCLETADLSHRYSNGQIVLDRIGLQVPQGSIYGFLGPNGAGKTTTLRLILGLLKKQQGTISIFGRTLEEHRVEILRGIGSLIESPSLYDHVTAAENLTVLQKVYRVPKARIGEVLRLVGLGGIDNRTVSQFSLGMKQRLSIAVALLHRPALLILDEPTNGLDPNGIVDMRDLLKTLNRMEGTTIVISSHLLSEIERLVTHLGIVHRGKIVFQGTLDELRRMRQRLGSVLLQTNDNRQALRIVSEMLAGVSLTDNGLTLPALSDERIAWINRSLVQQGIDVHELRATNNDLEAIFMDLIGG